MVELACKCACLTTSTSQHVCICAQVRVFVACRLVIMYLGHFIGTHTRTHARAHTWLQPAGRPAQRFSIPFSLFPVAARREDPCQPKVASHAGLKSRRARGHALETDRTCALKSSMARRRRRRRHRLGSHRAQEMKRKEGLVPMMVPFGCVCAHVCEMTGQFTAPPRFHVRSAINRPDTVIRGG